MQRGWNHTSHGDDPCGPGRADTRSAEQEDHVRISVAAADGGHQVKVELVGESGAGAARVALADRDADTAPLEKAVRT